MLLMDAELESKLEEVIERATTSVHAIVFMDNQLTSTQMKYCWLRVMGNLLTSTTLDYQTELLREQLLIQQRRATGSAKHDEGSTTPKSS